MEVRSEERDKVVIGLACCRENTPDDPFQRCGECPYNDHGINVEDCRGVLSSDALEALHDQERQIAALKEKLRLLEYGNQDAAQIPIMPAT